MVGISKVKRIRDYGIKVGELEPGEKNKITDVMNVRVGHVTLKKEEINTGVTAILPNKDIFNNKVVAASEVVNGYGKSMGLVQVKELGTIETPVVLTNTLNVGIAHQAIVDYMLQENEEIGDSTGTVNPVVGECNDQFLNDIRGLHIKKEHIHLAIRESTTNFAEGAVGAGTGTSCFGLKGGIGSASRKIIIGNKKYNIGILVQSNFGQKRDFCLGGRKAGKIIKKIDDKEGRDTESRNREKGSIIIVLATDIPLTSRQLERVARRCEVGLIRTGSYLGNGSGDIVIAFSTGNIIEHNLDREILNIKRLNEVLIDKLFRGTAEATEEAIYNSLITAETTRGRKGRVRFSLKKYIDRII